MRATVFPIAVASLFVGTPASASTALPAFTFATTSTSAQAQAASAAGDTLRLGGRVIAAGDTVTGPVLVAAGDLRVRGTIVGTAISLLGDVVVEEGGSVTGDAIAILGNVMTPAGAVGAWRDPTLHPSMSSRATPRPRRRARARERRMRWRSLSAGWS